jgi:hypothetical protein
MWAKVRMRIDDSRQYMEAARVDTAPRPREAPRPGKHCNSAIGDPDVGSQ